MERTLTLIAAAIAAVAALTFPAAYYAFGRASLDAALRTEAEINARLATGIVNKNPELWQFETARLEDLLSRRPDDGTPERRRIVDAGGRTVALSTDTLAAPIATATMPVHDSGVPVGRIEIARSLQPLLAGTAVAGLLGLLLATALFFALRVLPLRSLRGALAALMAERERAFELARERDTAAAAARVKADFLAVMSHEIRTPMNGVLGMTELLLASPLDERQRRFTETAHSSARALLRIIDDILDFSKIEAGQLPLERAAFSPLELVEDIVQSLAPRAHAAGLELGVLVAAGVPEQIEGDAGRLRQIVTNLLGNAIKFTERGTVCVELDLQCGADAGCALRLAVRDTGIGLAPAALARVFEPFVQADRATSRRYGGTGLGLAISRRLAEALGGTLTAESQEGAGSCFTLMLPLEGAPAAPAPNIAYAPRIALVDAGSLSARAIDSALRRLGAVPEHFAGVEPACAALGAAARDAEPYALLLLGPGVDAAERARLESTIETACGLQRPRIVRLRRIDAAAAAEAAPARGRELPVPARSAELRALLLRCGAEPVRTRAGSTLPAPAQGLRGRRVLVVEDDAVNQMVAVAMLDVLGMASEVAADGAAALQALEAAEFDLVLMDCQMPGMDGFQAVRRIRARERESGSHQIVIALTANVTGEDRARCIEAGMDDFLAKPLTAEALRERLQAWLTPTQSQPAALQF